ncbi:hypothetical protein HaLaN_23595 [Haematococcus lacustris]|uniref:Uncharacterized protein n=1 Tax=Haematococcus lacustris TaxID=44745 RepID=A0A699ZS34_HAELA|nr:hypothetical protein HaLaN_23595 [Haematococcus lacustris]
MRDAAAWWASAASAVKSDAALLPGLPGDAVALLLQRLLLLAWSSQQVMTAGCGAGGSGGGVMEQCSLHSTQGRSSSWTAWSQSGSQQWKLGSGSECACTLIR